MLLTGSAEGERYRYIGIDKGISELPQVKKLQGDYHIDDELREIIDIGKELKKYPTKFFTCHCTGEPAYKIMKLSMGEQLQYVHSGEEVDLSSLVSKNTKKERSSFMKWHKFFAWATVFCFVMTMVTGYKRQ